MKPHIYFRNGWWYARKEAIVVAANPLRAMLFAELARRHAKLSGQISDIRPERSALSTGTL